MLLVAGLCAGCGTQAKKPETNDSVKKEQEENARVEQLAELVQYESANSYMTRQCIYRRVSTESGMMELVQSDWNGKEQHRYSLGEDTVIEGISEKYVCYEALEKDGTAFALYLAPVKQTKQGEEVQLEKSEKIAETDDGFDAYVWESKVYYIRDYDEDGKSEFYCYDAEKREKKCLLTKEGLGFCEKWGGPVVTYDGKLYLEELEDDGTSLYCMDRETAELTSLGTWKNCVLEEVLAVTDDFIFATIYDDDEDEELWYSLYDIRKKEKKADLTWDQIENFLKQQGMWKKGAGFSVKDSRSRGNGLDFIVDLYWTEKVRATTGPQKGKEVEMSKGRQILLHCPWEDLTALSVDKKLSQWMDEDLNYTDVFITVPPTVNVASHYSIVSNRIVYGFYGEELLIACQELERRDVSGKEISPDESLCVVEVKSFQWKAYQPDSGRFRDIPKTDPLYQVISGVID